MDGRMFRVFLALLGALALGGCVGGGGAGDGDGVRQVGDMTIVSDVDGGRLIIDGDGCQSVAVPGSNVAVPVTDAAGVPACIGPNLAQ